MPTVSWITYGLIALNVCLVGILVVVAKGYIHKLREKKRGEQKRLAFLEESIVTLSQVMLQNQIEGSEACLRLNYLLEQYYDERSFPWKAEIQSYAKDLEGMAILDQRQGLTHRERFQQDLRRKEIEIKHKKTMIELCRYYSNADNLNKKQQEVSS